MISRIIENAVRVLMLSCLAVAVTGCTKFSERTHARYEIGTPGKVRPAEPGGLYEVKWSATPGGPKKTLAGTQRLVARGAAVGFIRDNDGTILAIAGPDTFPLPSLPNEARLCVWSTSVPKQTQLSKNLEGTGRVAGAGAAVAGLLAMNVLFNSMTGSDSLWLWPGDNDVRIDNATSAHDGKNHSHPEDPRPTPQTTDRGGVPWSTSAKMQP